MNGPAMPYYFPPAYPPSPQMAEREAIRFVSQRLGFALLLMQGISVVLQTLVTALSFILAASDLTSIFGVFTNPAFLWVLNVALTLPMFTIPFILSARMMRLRVGELLPLGRVRVSLCAALAAVVLGVAMVGNFLSGVLSEILGGFGFDVTPPDYPYPEGAFGKVLALLAISAVPALLEEFAFRGVFMGALRRFGDLFAICMSAAFFGLMHGNLTQIPFAFIVGLALGFAVKASGSLWPAVIAHFLNNLFSVLLDMLAESAFFSETENLILQDLYFVVVLVAALSAAAWLLRERKISLRDDRYDQALYTKEKAGAFFRAPAMIAATAVTVGMMALSMVAAQILKAFGLE